jgi:hypothetical protein
MLGQRRNLSRPRKPRGSCLLSDAKLQQREQVYQIYQGMGPARSIVRLERLLSGKHPTLRVSRPTLERWSVQHEWAARVKVHDAAIGNSALAQPLQAIETDPIGALMTLTTNILARAAAAAPAVSRPTEVKAMIDAAANALKLVEQIKASRTSKTTAEEIGAEFGRMIEKIESKRREDGLEMAIDILREQGVDPSKLEAELRAIQEKQSNDRGFVRERR